MLAQEEARLLDHDHIGTEHVLLGLLHEGEGVAARALGELGVSLEAVRAQVQEAVGEGGSPPVGHIPFTPRAKKVLELSLREALDLGHAYIGTEHLLLGLVREGQGVAAQVLVRLGADLPLVRQHVMGLLEADAGEPQPGKVEHWAPTELQAPFVPAEDMPACPHCRAPLAASATTKVLDVSLPEAATTSAVAFVYCGRCGLALGPLKP